MGTNKIFTCDCGFQWLQGRDGSHSCAPHYQKTITELRAPLTATLRGDEWITAKVARHLDIAFRNGASAGWNAGVAGDEDALASLKGRVGTRAEYAALFTEGAPAVPSVQATRIAELERKLAFATRSADAGCVLLDRADSLEPLRTAVGAFIKAKGRYHTEQSYQALVAAFDAATGETPP